jgi:hypothetical protein
LHIVLITQQIIKKESNSNNGVDFTQSLIHKSKVLTHNFAYSWLELSLSLEEISQKYSYKIVSEGKT